MLSSNNTNTVQPSEMDNHLLIEDHLKVQLQFQMQQLQQQLSQQQQQQQQSVNSNHNQHSLPLEDATNKNILRIKREKRKQLRLREYRNLCKIIPSLHGLNEVPKVKIINEAVKYIDELHQRLIHKIIKSSQSQSHSPSLSSSSPLQSPTTTPTSVTIPLTPPSSEPSSPLPSPQLSPL